MKYSILLWTCGLALSCLTALGCSDTSGSAPTGGGGDGDAGGNGGELGAAGGSGGSDATGGSDGGRRVPLLATVSEMETLSPVGGAPLEGASLCETDTDNCAETDGDGRAIITLPENAEVSYTVSKEGYVSYLVADVTDSELRPTFWPMMKHDLAEFALAVLGHSPPFDGGHLIVRATGQAGNEGVAFELMSEEATPFYQVAGTWAGTWDLTETTSTGQGGFLELAPGVHEVRLSGNCTPSIAWPGASANEVRVPVKDGHFSYASMICDAL